MSSALLVALAAAAALVHGAAAPGASTQQPAALCGAHCELSEEEHVAKEEEHVAKVSLLQTHLEVSTRPPPQEAGAALLGVAGQPVDQRTPVSFAAFVAEYIAMTLFVFIGCGSAMGIAKEPGSAWVLQVSLTFGLAISSLAYAVGHYSGGHINCAVTFGLVLVGQVTILQGLANVAAQLLGSVTGALLLLAVYPAENDRTGGLGSNAVGKEWPQLSALIGETLMTFLLVFVVLETATNPLSAPSRAQACVAIGLAVFLAHSVLVPIDGCSINPTRSFGPALVAKLRDSRLNTFADMWIFWTGPLLGAAAAAGASAALMT